MRLQRFVGVSYKPETERQSHYSELRAARAYDQRALQGDLEIIYNFGQDLIDEHAIEVSAEQVTVPGFSQPLVYKKDARFSDMLD